MAEKKSLSDLQLILAAAVAVIDDVEVKVVNSKKLFDAREAVATVHDVLKEHYKEEVNA